MRYITPTTTVLVVAALAGAGTAAADVHIDPSGHGGRPLQQLAMRAAVASTASAPAVRLGGESKQHQPVVASLSKGRKTVRLNLAYNSKCDSSSSGDPMFSTSNLAAAKIRKGRYSLTRTSTDQFGDGYTVVESYSAHGRLVKTRMSGAVRIKDTLYAPDGSVADACDSGRVRFTAQRSGVFAGTTDYGDPVVLTFTASRDRVKSLMIPWVAECNSGNWIWGTTHLSDTVRQGGAFGGTWSKATASANDETMTSTYTLGGALLAHSAFGSWRVSASFTDPSQNVVDSCDNYGLDFQVK